ncbi:hypothetical protein VF04_03855 [Nostoc linckia z7]|uniref:Uncharacterized protein n=2 Tax=Nostoc linckia TaxID=92942 RepID=A0A9Q5ZGC0_NOSLI|nr:hypothetical protein [Nostoc linckia]PHK42992.1 hypothetical protein VF12_01320 [Nostoc linckia z15]PHK48149.1 hypothetical protein VF13_02295 [Nostoc linckia z16]PHJ64933.1 hypothetical protein VF02_11345 [Nostoc linckia z1]PHJ70110.1 hypothetical protein VF05_11500 [Nostoc linckia z3]PHJ75011.1 hypothetical protein VF03_11660 [Nostoc linckia z2]
MGIKKIYRAWLEAKQEVIQALAIPHLVKISVDKLQMTFKTENQSSELNAIALGLDYEVQHNIQTIELLQAHPKSQNSRLKNTSGKTNFHLIESELSSAIAYYLVDSNQKSGEGIGLEVVSHPDEVFDDDQIAINSEGRIYISKNVKDKIVKVRTPVIYPRQVIVMQNDLEQIIAHLVCLSETGNVEYLEIKGNLEQNKGVSAKNKLTTIKINIVEKRVEVLD